jgi:hypothetical protein
VTDAAGRCTAPGQSGPWRFNKNRYSPMPVEESRRQSLAVQAAWRHFGEPGPVIAFLNTRHEAVDARPLHLAIQSDEGLQRVERLLKQLTPEA